VDETHDKGRTPRMQEQNALFLQDLDGGEIPLKGIFSIDRWAKKLERCRKTLERELQKNRIPHKRVCGTIYIDAEDLWKYSPGENQREEGKRRR
jgi:hypothetical protein